MLTDKHTHTADPGFDVGVDKQERVGGGRPYRGVYHLRYPLTRRTMI